MVILNQDFELKNKTEIHLVLASDLELDRFKSLRPPLLDHLRRSLENHSIEITAEVRHEVGTKKAYTNSDKFKVMIDKNPALAELKDRLGLDPDV
jgi:DNA polymerase-3 subunit gamma/tau